MKKTLFVLTLLLMLSSLVAGCGPAPEKPAVPPTFPAETPTSAPPTATPDPTRPEVVDDVFTIEIEDQPLTIGLVAADPEADLSGVEVRSWQMGPTVLVRVTDPSGRFAPISDFFSQEDFADGSLAISLTEIEEDQGNIRRMELPEPDVSGLDYVQTGSTGDFIEDLTSKLGPDEYYTLYIELDDSDQAAETVDIYALPFENAFILFEAEQTSFLDWLFGVTPAKAAVHFDPFRCLVNELHMEIMRYGAENRPTDYSVPIGISTAGIEGIRYNLSRLSSDLRYDLVGLECNNRALASLKIDLAAQDESYWLTDEDLRTGYAVASKPAIGMPWFKVEWEATSLSTIDYKVIEERNLTVWYCKSVIKDVDLGEAAEQCSGDNCKTLTIDNPQGIDGSITLVGPQLYQFDISQGKSTYALENGTYNFALAMCGGEWISNGNLKPEHNWMIGMPDSCTW